MSKPIPFVGPASLAIAKEITNYFTAMRAEFGIIFISVQPVPALDGLCTRWRILVGISMTSYAEAVGALVDTCLRSTEGLKGHTFQTEIALGTAGQCRS